ncbi:TPA: restriction endonuclease subunit S [Streptococcus suis]|nr:restriction endonuclease subunit S [Streptococcus suis]
MTKEKSTVPRLRFPGFTTTWKQRKLGEEISFYNGRAYKQSELLDVGKYKVVRVGNFNTNEKWYYSNLELEDSKTIDTGDLIYLWATSFGPEIWKGAKSIYHYHIWKLIIKQVEKIDKNYLYTWLYQDKEKIAQNTNGSTMVHITKKMIENRDFEFPTLPEQEAIGSFFSDLDQLITLHQRKLDDVKELKKALLQKMFPKGNGNDFPELRFPEFTDAWKQRKLGEVGYAKSGVGFPEKEQGGTTGIPFFKVSDMNTNGNENELVVANNYVTDEQISKRKWRVITEVPAIFFAKVGAAVMLNRKRLIRHPFLLDNNTMTYVFNHTQWDTNFGKTLFETIDLIQLTQVGALPSYNSSDVENINISLPTLPEQEAIGSFFSDLDQLITLHQRQLDHLKLLKKALLQQMFI